LQRSTDACETAQVSAGTSSSGAAGLGAGGGDCGALARAHDWAGTPLGAVEAWPPSLRTAATICLESRHGICLFWGPELVAVYNDAYAPMLGAKHPWALGKPLREIWPEIWDQIGPMLKGVVDTGEATWQEDQPLTLHRRGFAEEAYFTYSFSPIRDGSGRVAGVFTAVQETSGRVVGTRRLQALAGLGEALAAASTEAEVAAAALSALARCPEDVPFAALYLLGGDGTPHFAGATGTGDRWHAAARAAAAGERTLTDERAVLLPVGRPDAGMPAAALVLGAAERRHLDDGYREFFRQIARQLAAAFSSAAGLAAVQARADGLAELDRAKTEFFSNVSHEFRTPLTLMLGPLSDALADPGGDPAELRERIEIAQRGALRLLRLVNALLDLSRLESGRVVPVFAPVDIGRLARDSAASFAAAVERAQLSIGERSKRPPQPSRRGELLPPPATSVWSTVGSPSTAPSTHSC
jgi:signal transduction histidine kinase